MKLDYTLYSLQIIAILPGSDLAFIEFFIFLKNYGSLVLKWLGNLILSEKMVLCECYGSNFIIINNATPNSIPPQYLPVAGISETDDERNTVRAKRKCPRVHLSGKIINNLTSIDIDAKLHFLRSILLLHISFVEFYTRGTSTVPDVSH